MVYLKGLGAVLLVTALVAAALVVIGLGAGGAVNALEVGWNLAR